ncbi:MAG: IS21-like element helper ATPase IstB [Thermodesulfobacteriota bacterium]
MTPGDIVLRENLRRLNLTHILRNLESILRQAREKGETYEEVLLATTEIELQMRAESRLKRWLHEAKFPVMKTLEGFDWEASKDLDKRQIRELIAGDYIRDRRNVIFVGKPGTGKTHLATGLGIEACRAGVRTRFVTGCGLVNELIEARDEKRLSRVIQKYSRYGLLVLDELGYVPFSKEGSELLFQVLTERHERGSVVITTNLGFADWTQVFGDPTLTAALLDRLTHKAHIINCTWESAIDSEKPSRQGRGCRPAPIEQLTR